MGNLQLITPDRRLVVTKLLPSGEVDAGSVQPLEEWERGERRVDLLQHRYGPDLLDILTHDLGLVTVDEEGMLQSRIVIYPNDHGINGPVMRLLGKIAEALVVRNCQRDHMMNRRWAMVARKGTKLVSSPDKYQAVGTGLERTNRLNPQKFRSNDQHRDVIWVDRENLVDELRMLNHGISAGLQIKTSTDGFKYFFRSDVASAKYEVPIVYFDLCDDYYAITNAIYREDAEVVIGRDIVRGRDIDPACHEELCSYRGLVEQLMLGRLTPNDLLGQPLLFDAFVKQVQEDRGAAALTI